MSAPLQLTSGQMRQVADAIDDLTAVRRKHGIEISGYGRPEIRHIDSDTTLTLAWDDERGYAVDDRVGE